MYVVYMHTCPNGKRYIGITKQDIDKRWKKGDGYRKCTAFWRAIQKFGWDNISHEIIDTCDTLDEANELEKKYISQFKTHNSEYGYNCTDGGDGVQGWRASEIQKEKNSESKKKMWEDEEMRKRLTEERRKRGNTEEEKARLTYYRNATWADSEMREKLVAHLSEIANDPQLKAQRSAKLKEQWKQNPEKFMEKRDYTEIGKKHSGTMKQLWEEDRERFLKNRPAPKTGGDHPSAKAIICVETGVVYPCARDADRELGISYKSISRCVCGKGKTAGGFHWKYYHPDEEPSSNENGEK